MSPKLLNILLFVSSLVIYFYVIDPMYTGVESALWTPEQSIQSATALNAQYDATIAGVDSIISQANSILGKYKEINATTTSVLMTMIPDTVQDIVLLSELSEVASENSIPLSDLIVKDKDGEFDVIFTMKTTYPKFKKFIEYYDKSMRLLTLKSVSFTPTKNEQEEIKFNVGFSAYYMK